MKISLYQDDRECFFWTREELNFIEASNATTFKSYANNPDVFSYRGHLLNVYRGMYNGITNNGEFDINSDCIIIVLQYGAIENETFKKFISHIKNNPEKKFIIIAKCVEDYWVSMEIRTSDTLLKQIADMNNIKVIWDVEGIHYNNFYFEPKVNFHNYYNNTTFAGYMFINGSDIFHKLPKEHRIGIHLNKITDKVRKWLFRTYNDNTNPNLFFTSKIHRNDSSVFNNQLQTDCPTNVNETWYHDQFIELTTKSQMEVIYETFTTICEHRWLLKWNEKTIKQLFLSKPFIHSDPAAHSLFKVNGLKAYRSLFTDELWDMYEAFDNQKLLLMNHSGNEIWWSEALERNINWLLDMDTTEWNERISEANKVAKENREVIEGYLFNQSLFKYVE